MPSATIINLINKKKKKIYILIKIFILTHMWLGNRIFPTPAKACYIFTERDIHAIYLFTYIHTYASTYIVSHETVFRRSFGRNVSFQCYF